MLLHILDIYIFYVVFHLRPHACVMTDRWRGVTRDRDKKAHRSKWSPPEGQFASLDIFINKCRYDIDKLNFNRNTNFSNLSSEERAHLKILVSVKT